MKLDHLKDVVRALVRKEVAKLDYMATYPAKVLSQSGQAVDVEPDDARLPKMTNLPIRHGLPGVEVKVAAGARILVGFAGGNPKKPEAYLWESGSLQELTITASTKVVVNSPSAEICGPGALGVARIGDSVVAGGLSGVIMAGSSKVKAG